MEGCIWYLNNILIYGGDTEAVHQAIVEKVLQQYVEHGLAVNLFKSKFHVYKCIFLKYVINGLKLNMDPSKLQSMYKSLSIYKRRQFRHF